VKTIFRSALAASAVALVTLAIAFGSASAAEKKKAEAQKKPPACNSLTDEKACEARDDCTWVSAVIDAKTKKQKRKAYCRTKPKPPAKKKTEKKT
jgi:hypothetical protein